MYMDRHDLPGVTPEELADAHMRDVEVQERHGVRYHTYWFDPSNGSVFCLAEGPSKQAVETVHKQAPPAVAFAAIDGPIHCFHAALQQPVFGYVE